jgi:hypothetical protein
MGLPRGRTIPLSRARRIMVDLMNASCKVPLVAIERSMPLGDVVDARQRLFQRPSWFAIFLKAYAAVCARRPVLRQAYLSWPWPRIHQHECTVASLAVARPVDGEDGVLFAMIRFPEQMSMGAIDAFIRAARCEPVERFGDFRRHLLLSRLPRFLRRLAWWMALDVSGDWRARFAGTFGVTGVAALGSASLSLLSPLTTTLTYGQIGDDGRVNVRLFYDHRVMDGVQPAAALEELQTELCGSIRDELLASAGRTLSIAA